MKRHRMETIATSAAFSASALVQAAVGQFRWYVSRRHLSIQTIAQAPILSL